MTTPSAYPSPEKASSQAVTGLVLGIVGLFGFCCLLPGLAAPFAWYLGKQELKAIQEGRSSPAGQGMAQAAQIMGIIGCIGAVLWLLWVFFWGGMAMIEGFRNQ